MSSDSLSAQLSLTDAQMRELLSGSPVMFHSTGADGHIRYHDGRLARTLGYSGEEFDRLHVLDLYHPVFRADARRIFKNFLRTGSFVGEKMHMMRKDGKCVWTRLLANTIRDAEGRIVGSRSIVELIDERSRSRHELGESTLRFLKSAARQLDRLDQAKPSFEQTEADRAVDLTRRESEVLNLVARGATNADIADQLQIAPSTARFHVSNVLKKLGLRNRVEAAAYALRAGSD